MKIRKSLINLVAAGTLILGSCGKANANSINLCDLKSPGTVINGGFESGDETGWEPEDWGLPWFDGESSGLHVTTEPHTGNYSRLIHNDNHANLYHKFFQEIEILPERSDLGFWLNVDLNPNSGWYLQDPVFSLVGVDIRNSATDELIANLVTIGGSPPAGQYQSAHYGTDGWEKFDFDLSQYLDKNPLKLQFWIHTGNNFARANQRMYVDDVTIPEPSTMSLLILAGLSGSGFYMLRKKKD